MIQTTVRTDVDGKDIRIPIPAEYAGKELHILVYSNDEIEDVSNESKVTQKKPSSYFGTLTKDEGERLLQHVKKSRDEWERDF